LHDVVIYANFVTKFHAHLRNFTIDVTA